MKVIEIKNIAKEYQLGMVAKDSIADTFRSIVTKGKRKEKETFNALKDISFDVMQGDVLGIIGKNGAGKSTLLKILSRITEPSSGEIIMRGRVASLLEVGTGFHPELSGRENIFLNGSILGMTRGEIKSKFNEIVEFSGVEKFIDTPVKHYSSGMYVRLAFSVAAHLDPEVLIIDEVLAVGDAEFQKKCLGKMKDVAGKGRTVIFVSHNMSAVKSLCSRAVVLNKGEMVFSGEAEDAITHYLFNEYSSTSPLKKEDPELDNEFFTVSSIGIHKGGEEKNPIIYQDDDICFEVTLKKHTDDKLSFNFRVKDENENYIFSNGSLSKIPNQDKTGSFVYKMKLPGNILNQGKYLVDFGVVKDKKFILLYDNYLSFKVEAKKKKGSFFGKSKGVLNLDLEWECL